MKSKFREPTNDDFVSIHELRIRNRNKLQSNYLKDEQKQEQQIYQEFENQIRTTRWEKLKNYLVSFTEDLIFEPLEEADEYSKPNMANKNLMLATESIHDLQYSSIQIARVSEDMSLSSILNSILGHLEQLLKSIQIGLILDAETLEFNRDACKRHINNQLPEGKEITFFAKLKKIIPKRSIKYNRLPGAINQYFIDQLRSFAKFLKQIKSQNESITSLPKIESNNDGNDP